MNPVYVVGKVRQAKLTPDRTILIGGHGKINLQYGKGLSPLDERVRHLENILEGEDLLLGEAEREEIMERVAKLKGGLAIL